MNKMGTVEEKHTQSVAWACVRACACVWTCVCACVCVCSCVASLCPLLYMGKGQELSAEMSLISH